MLIRINKHFHRCSDRFVVLTVAESYTHIPDSSLTNKCRTDKLVESEHSYTH